MQGSPKNPVWLGRGVAFLVNQMDKDRGTVLCSSGKKIKKVLCVISDFILVSARRFIIRLKLIIRYLWF